MPQARDSQRKKFYSAFKILKPYAVNIPKEKTQRYVDDAFSRKFLHRRYHVMSTAPAIGKSETTRWSIDICFAERSERGTVAAIGASERWLLYGIARVIFYRLGARSEGWAFHGPKFCRILLDVVQAVKGKPAADMLKEAFRLNSVRHREKKQVTVTLEMRERLAVARAKRHN